MEITKATLDDLKKIQELNLKSFEREYNKFDKLLNLNWTFSEEGTKYYKEKIKKSCVWVAKIDKKVIGYLCGDLTKAETYRNLPIVAELENMFVLEEFRSKGIGKQLYETFLQWCKSKNVGKIRVSASAQNNRAINFYKKIGFKDYTLILESDL